jgi:c-di-GMP-binding flagellar brake protein YcgR
MAAKSSKLVWNKRQKSALDSIVEAKDNGYSLLAWRIIGNKKFTVDLAVQSIRGQRELVFAYNTVDKQFVDVILNGSEFVNFFIEDTCFVFRCPLIKHFYAKREIVVSYPELMAVQERRKNFRLRMDKFRNTISFKKPVKDDKKIAFHKEAYDISKGGLSFFMTSLEAKYYSDGDIVKNVIIEFAGYKLNVDIKLVNLLPIDADDANKRMYNGHKACFCFERISERDANVIDRFVLSNLKFKQSA